MLKLEINLVCSATDSESHIARKKTNTDKILARLLEQQHHHYHQFGQATSSPTARRGASRSRRWPAIGPTPSTGSDRFHAQETSYIFKSVTNSYVSNISVSGLRQELFPDAITAKRSLFDSDHSLPGLLSIHCYFVDLKERVLYIWVGWRWGIIVASVLHWSLHCDKAVESCEYSWYTWSIVQSIQTSCASVSLCCGALVLCPSSHT